LSVGKGVTILNAYDSRGLEDLRLSENAAERLSRSLIPRKDPIRQEFVSCLILKIKPFSKHVVPPKIRGSSD
jgi:hypothetical protein